MLTVPTVQWVKPELIISPASRVWFYTVRLRMSNTVGNKQLFGLSWPSSMWNITPAIVRTALRAHKSFKRKLIWQTSEPRRERGGKKSEKKCSIVETKQMSVAHVVLRKCVVCIVLSLCFGYKVLWLQCMFTHNIWMVTLTMNNTHTHTLNPISLKWKSISAQTVFNVESRAQCKCVRS